MNIGQKVTDRFITGYVFTSDEHAAHHARLMFYYWIDDSSTRILVRDKNDLKSFVDIFSHVDELAWVIPYANAPESVYLEFSKVWMKEDGIYPYLVGGCSYIHDKKSA